jgi:hypothetical protein
MIAQEPEVVSFLHIVFYIAANGGYTNACADHPLPLIVQAE